MQTKYLCVLVRVWIGVGVGAVRPVFLLVVRGRCFFCGSFMFFLSYVCYVFVRVCLFVPCGHLLGKG